MRKRTTTQWQSRLDALFGKIVRAKGYCERCKKKNGVQFQTSHIYSRTYKEIRWDLLNSQCLCASCHFWWHKNPMEAGEWIKEYLGEEKYEELKKRRQKTRQWWEGEYKKVEEELLNYGKQQKI